jgi:hypothetical protein
VKIRVVELMDYVLSTYDRRIGEYTARMFKRQGEAMGVLQLRVFGMVGAVQGLGPGEGVPGCADHAAAVVVVSPEVLLCWFLHTIRFAGRVLWCVCTRTLVVTRSPPPCASPPTHACPVAVCCWFMATGIDLVLNSRVASVRDGYVKVVSKSGSESEIAFGACVWATGIAMNPLVKQLQEVMPEQTHFR